MSNIWLKWLKLKCETNCSRGDELTHDTGSACCKINKIGKIEFFMLKNIEKWIEIFYLNWLLADLII